VKVRFDALDVPLRLSMLAAGADGDGVVLDDVADAEAFAGGGAEAELAQGRVTAVGGREDGVVDLVPAAVGEEGRHVRRWLFARGRWGGAIFVCGKGVSFGGPDV